MPEDVHAPVTAEELAHAFEEEAAAVRLSDYAVEDWITLAVFFGMAVAVFLQFFTRYVLNDSLAWTEEIAIYCLVAVVFLGSAMCTRTRRHIHVDVLYRLLPPLAGRVLALGVSLVTIGFFAYMAWLVWHYADVVSRERMVTINLPKGIVFYTVFAGFALMMLRQIQVFVVDLRRGYSILERPDAYDVTGE